MTEPLQHDPRTKQQIKDTIYESLYAPVQKQFEKRIETLILKNAMAMGYSHKSFTYKGEFYSCDPSTPPLKANRLAPQLRSAMDEYLKELKALNDYEVPYVLGFINQVLNASNHLPDYLRVLPDSVHQPIKSLVATCPCRSKHLTDAAVQEIQGKNQLSIKLMKERMVRNLII